MVRQLILTLVLFGALLLPTFAQDGQPDPEKYLELLRSAFKTQKVALVTENMGLSKEAFEKFWPVYREYDAELTKLGDLRLALIKDYANNLPTMDDQKAEAMASRMLKLHEDRTTLRRAYYTKFKDAVGAIPAARFLQIDHQISLVVDSEIASNVPLITKTRQGK